MKTRIWSLLFMLSAIVVPAIAQNNTRVLIGRIVTASEQAVAGATITIRSAIGEKIATSDAEGNFKLEVPREAFILRVKCGLGSFRQPFAD